MSKLAKIISVFVLISFVTGQIQTGFADSNLGLVPVGDNTIGVEKPGVKGSFVEETEPGAIGRGMPWEALLRGDLPAKIDLKGIPFSEVIKGDIPEGAEVKIPPESLRKIVAVISRAVDLARTNFDKVPEKHQERTLRTIDNLLGTLAAIYNNDFEQIHLFNARSVIFDSANYLLGFNYRKVPGLAVDLIDFLTLDEAAQYVFHEHIPEEHEIGHKIAYEEIQAPIFWGIDGNTLGIRFREFISSGGGIKDADITVITTGMDIPTIRGRYGNCKKRFARGAFGDQLVFGTSGIREYVKFLEDIKCYAIAKAILSYMKEIGEPGAMALAGDFRPSTDRIMTTQIMAAEEMGKQVIYGGRIPTPAIVYFGMYREEGAVPSSMVTASHCPVLPLEIEQNGIKPNRITGEVLKEDERRILKHVREFMEIEFMMRGEQSMFEDNGMMKGEENLSQEQITLLEKALGIQKKIDSEARRMYVDRYVEGFGRIFDETDEIAFIEHMAVGRDMIKEIFNGMGANVTPCERNADWVEGLIVDTEDIKPRLAGIVTEVAEKFKSLGKRLTGIFTTDGDSDRPALFQEDDAFVYGDKLGYITSEYIRNLTANRDKKMFVAVTATVSDAVIRRMEDIGIEVAQVKIGSPYVVKAMEDRLAKAEENGEEVIVAGFERNGGYLLGSNIVLDNGNTLKALPTRDAILPIVAAFHTAKKEGKTIGELISDRFSGEYSSFAWSGLIEATTVDEENPDNTELCKKYTATMGQAIMRSFSPRDLNIVEVLFYADGSIEYLMANGDRYRASNDDEFAKDMNSKKEILEGYFNAERGFAGGIDRMNFLDGVRMFLKKEDRPDSEIEVVHMRPSGNAPQWRIYTEAATLERAKEMTEYRLPVYPQIIGRYLKEKEQFQGTGITARDNQAMKDTFEGVFDTTQDEWTTWEMTFGARGEHSSKEGIIFGENNSTVSFYNTKVYNIVGALAWLAREGFSDDKLTVERSITWNREKGTLTCSEKWSDGRETAVVLSGKDAWLEIGRGLDKNTPMGKFQDMPFPVMSDRARTYFREKGINWFDLFDVSVESEFTVEAPMWAHNFDFQKKTDVPGDDTPEEDSRIEKILRPTTPEELMKAQDFYVYNMIRNLRKLTAQDPEKKHLLAINMEIGGEYQQVFTNNLLKKISELQGKGEFGNLLTIRGRNAEDLAVKVSDLVDDTEGLDMNGVVIITRNIDIEEKRYSAVQGRAVIAGIEDRGDIVSQSYLPVLETISIALGIAYGKDYEAIKSIYDIITEDDVTLSPDQYEQILTGRIIRIIPRARAFNTDDLRALYQRALEILIRA
jgi:phosphomannomutase